MQEELCQFDAHTPATGEITCGAREIAALESETEKHLFHVFFEVGEIDGVEFLAHGRHLFDECHVFVALIVGALHELGVEGFDLALHVLEMLEGLARFFEYGATIFGHEVLRQVGNDRVFGCTDVSARGLSHAGQDFEQRGLTCTVFAHEGDAILLVDLKRNVFEECGSAEFDGQTINRYHERRERLDDEWTNEARGRETWRFDREEKEDDGENGVGRRAQQPVSRLITQFR